MKWKRGKKANIESRAAKHSEKSKVTAENDSKKTTEIGNENNNYQIQITRNTNNNNNVPIDVAQGITKQRMGDGVDIDVRNSSIGSRIANDVSDTQSKAGSHFDRRDAAFVRNNIVGYRQQTSGGDHVGRKQPSVISFSSMGVQPANISGPILGHGGQILMPGGQDADGEHTDLTNIAKFTVDHVMSIAVSD